MYEHQVISKFLALIKTHHNSHIGLMGNRLILFFRISTTVFFLCSGINISHAQIQDRPDYKFGISDQLQIRVFDLRSATGEAYQWPAFNSDYTIDSSGKISLPLIGSIDAVNLTSMDLQEKISQQLQTKVGLAQRPSTTVQVLKYRPFYIVGAIQNPGEYEYRPRLTMIQSLGVGGGLEKLSGPDKFTFDKNVISLKGELQQQKLQAASLMIKSARLAAEIKGLSSFTVSSGEISDVDLSKTMNIIDDEKNIISTKHNLIIAQLGNLNSTIETLKDQIKSLENKDLTQQRQLDLSKQEANQLNDLLAKGLVSTNRKINADQVVAGIESNKLDILISKLKSQQDLKNTQKEIIDIRDKQRVEAMNENTTVKSKIIDLNKKIETLQDLINQSNSGNDPGLYSQIKFRVQRLINGKTTSLVMSDGDLVAPGDVIIVEQSRINQQEIANVPSRY